MTNHAHSGTAFPAAGGIRTIGAIRRGIRIGPVDSGESVPDDPSWYCTD